MNGKLNSNTGPRRQNTNVGRERRKRVVKRSPATSRDNSSDGGKTRTDSSSIDRTKLRLSTQSSKETSSDGSETDGPLVAARQTWGAPWASSNPNENGYFS